MMLCSEGDAMLLLLLFFQGNVNIFFPATYFAVVTLVFSVFLGSHRPDRIHVDFRSRWGEDSMWTIDLITGAIVKLKPAV